MAILTWKNIPTPDIGASQQQGIRTAGDLLNRAVGNASAGVGEFQKIQAAEKAAQVQAADKFMLEKMLSAQTPEQLQAMQGDGSLMGSPAAGLASPETLLMADARKDLLQKRSDQDFDRVWNRDEAKYSRERTRGQHESQDAAASIYAENAALAQKDPAAAMKRMEQTLADIGVKLHQDDAMKYAKGFHDLYIAPDRANQARWQDQQEKEAASDLFFKWQNETDEKKRASILDNAPSQRVKLAAYDLINTRGGDSRNLISPTPQTQSGASLPAHDAYRATQLLTAAEENLRVSAQKLPNAAKNAIAALGREMESPSQSAEFAAKRLKEAGVKDVEVADITGYIAQIQKRAGKANITPAEAAGLILDNLDTDGFFTFKDFGANIDKKGTTINALVDDWTNNRSAALEYQKEVKSLDKAKKLQEDVAKLWKEAEAARFTAERGKSANSEKDYRQKLRRYEMRRDQLLGKRQESSSPSTSSTPQSDIDLAEDIKMSVTPESFSGNLALDKLLRGG